MRMNSILILQRRESSLGDIDHRGPGESSTAFKFIWLQSLLCKLSAPCFLECFFLPCERSLSWVHLEGRRPALVLGAYIMVSPCCALPVLCPSFMFIINDDPAWGLMSAFHWVGWKLRKNDSPNEMHSKWDLVRLAMVMHDLPVLEEMD